MEGGEYFGPFLEDYFAESEEHITLLRRALLTLEGDRGSPLADEALRAALRSLHTLKGLSGMVGFAEVEHLAHVMEDWARAGAPNGAFPVQTSLDPLFEGVAAIERAIVARRDGAPPPDAEQTIRALEAVPWVVAAPTQPAPPALAPAERHRLEAALARGDTLLEFEFTPSPELMARGVKVESVRARLSELGEILNATPRVLPGRGVAFRFLVALPPALQPPEAWHDDAISWSAPPAEEEIAPAETASPGAGVSSTTMVRVELSRLDELMRLVGELVVGRSRLQTLVSEAGRQGRAVSLDALEELNSSMERQLRDLREGVMRVRLVPIGEVFERMRFVVRDIASADRKQVRVEAEGQGTEIDKLLVERLMEPMLHLVRNAVSHGIEPPAEREARGKPAEGRITLDATALGERVRVQVADDGRGIPRAEVLQQARARGIPVSGTALDDDALLDVLCAPGFSMRSQADLASGRGIGMDVVRSNLRALGGEMTLWSVEGEGTRFTLELPLTLMIVDALLVGLGDQVMALPQPALLEVLQVSAAEVVTFENNEVVRYRDQVLPVLRLRALFGDRGTPEPESFIVLVVGTRAQPIGLAVDRVAGLREIVVRPLTDPLVAVPGISGAAELGDGRVCLILDAAVLASLAYRERAPRLPLPS